MANDLNKCQEVLTLREHIDRVHKGNQSEFARRNNTTPCQVQRWMNKGWIVIDGHLYARRRGLVGPVQW